MTPATASLPPPPSWPQKQGKYTESLLSKWKLSFSQLSTATSLSTDFLTSAAILAVWRSNDIERAGSSFEDTANLIHKLKADSSYSWEAELNTLSLSSAKAQREIIQHYLVLERVHKFARSKQPLTPSIVKVLLLSTRELSLEFDLLYTGMALFSNGRSRTKSRQIPRTRLFCRAKGLSRP